MNGLKKTISETLAEFKEGEIFFDNLDSRLTNKDYIVFLVKKFKLLNKGNNIFLSGKFGKYFWDGFHNEFDNIVLANGSLRNNKKLIIEKIKGQIQNREFHFVDDSFYSGLTQKRIKEFLNQYNSTVLQTFVLYDGSKKKHEDVFSLYRYFK